MKKAIFTLDTTPTLFAQWLSDFTKSIHAREFPAEYPEPQYPAENKGYYVLHAVTPQDHDVGEQPIVLEINCLYMVETEKGTIAYPGFWAIKFEIVPFARDQIKMTAECNNPAVMGYFKELLKEIAWLFPKSREAIEAKIGRFTSQQVQTEPSPPAGDGTGRKHGPTAKTQERAKVFKRLKDAHPEWTYYRVATEASEELGDVTGETVRNAYRAMGWEWERPDRVR